MFNQEERELLQRKNMTKYKACCSARCLLSNCKVRDNGGCQCVCRLVDAIHTYESVIEGTSISSGCCYVPDENLTKKMLDNMSEKERKKEDFFRTEIAPVILENLKRYLLEKTEPAQEKETDD
jgi:hypothetical protein